MIKKRLYNQSGDDELKDDPEFKGSDDEGLNSEELDETENLEKTDEDEDDVLDEE